MSPMALHESVVGWYLGLGPTTQRFVSVTTIVVVGWLILRFLRWMAGRTFPGRSHRDEMLRTFVQRSISGGGWVIILLMALPRLGVNVTALLGGVAVTGFILGFALKETLGNLAAGILILVYRPFQLGETVKFGENEGTVTAVGMAFTVLDTKEGTTVTVPNGKVIDSAILNRTRTPERRVDVEYGLHVNDDIGKAIRLVMERAAADPRVLPHRNHLAVVSALTSDGPSLRFGFWVKNEHFGAVRHDLFVLVKETLQNHGFGTQTTSLEVANVAAHEA